MALLVSTTSDQYNYNAELQIIPRLSFYIAVNTDGSEQIYPTDLDQCTVEDLVAESNVVLKLNFYLENFVRCYDGDI
jgi:hypothetical protein